MPTSTTIELRPKDEIIARLVDCPDSRRTLNIDRAIKVFANDLGGAKKSAHSLVGTLIMKLEDYTKQEMAEAERKALKAFDTEYLLRIMIKDPEQLAGALAELARIRS